MKIKGAIHNPTKILRTSDYIFNLLMSTRNLCRDFKVEAVKLMANLHKILKEKKKTNKNIEGKTTENKEIYAKDSKTSKSTERLQNQSMSDQ